jgi:hypothetical protein
MINQDELDIKKHELLSSPPADSDVRLFMSAEKDQITFVCCVESGSLEVQTVRMVESLRRYGGRYANAPIFAVTPRFGAPISPQTQQIFADHQVQHLVIKPHENSVGYRWNHFINKPTALLAVDERCTTEAIAWLDSDLLIVGEPHEFQLAEGENFLACTSDRLGGTTGPGDEMEPYWMEVCQVLGLDLEQLPWVKTAQEGLQVRYYFNSGVFVYRRGYDFAQQYLKNCLKMMDARVSSAVCGFFFTDQVALGLTAAQLEFAWRPLSYSHNYPVSPLTHEAWYDEARLRAARIVHYHHSMWQPFWTIFLDCLTETHPRVAVWMATIGPMTNPIPLPYKAFNKVLGRVRQNQKTRYKSTCTVY